MPVRNLLAEDRALLAEHNIEEHKNFSKWSHLQRLDYIGSRILANSRTTKSHHVMKEEGWLSYSQMERRKDREVYTAPNGQFEDLARLRGVFSRPNIDRDRGEGNENKDNS